MHELVARDVRGECVRQRTERKSVVSHSPQSHTTTRANIAHEKAEQIRARIACTPAYKGVAGVDKVSALTGRKAYLFILSVGCAWALCVGRELTDLRSKR